MAVPTTNIKLSDVYTEMNNGGLNPTTPFSLSQAINLAGKNGMWNKLSDFAGYAAAYLSVSPTSISAIALGGLETITVSSNTTWTASSSVAWITIQSGGVGTGNGTTSIDIQTNDTGVQRVGYVSYSYSGGAKSVTITQVAL